MRFDEVELEVVGPVDVPAVDAAAAPMVPPSDDATRPRRLVALLTDLSLFVALVLALSPLLPQPYEWTHLVALAGFVVVVSYYYFVGTWMLWGKSIGGAIFDVRVIPTDKPSMSLRSATWRWIGVCLSLLTAGLGFFLAVLPSRLSLPDRMSGTKCVAG